MNGWLFKSEYFQYVTMVMLKISQCYKFDRTPVMLNYSTGYKNKVIIWILFPATQESQNLKFSYVRIPIQIHEDKK